MSTNCRNENSDNSIIILDFGSQYSMLIARRIREARVYCEILPYHTSAAEIASRKSRGVIISGGPGSVYEEGAPLCDPKIFTLGVPVLGICYGMQLMAFFLRGQVNKGHKSELGKAEVHIIQEDPLIAGVSPSEENIFHAWMSHRDQVLSPPLGFQVTARTSNGIIAAMGSPGEKIYGLQFHPEVVHTTAGTTIINNFLFNICGCSPGWTPGNFIEKTIPEIQAEIGNKERVLCALSGGVDSSVVAFLLDKALKERVVCIFVDHGLIREHEAREINNTFSQMLKGDFIFIDARERFLKKLTGITDPEEKRRIIGREFIEVFKDAALSLKGVNYLAQGTIYSDVIESGSLPSAETIKSHHNVGGLPAELGFKLIEPLKELFKDEVRQVGRQLGIPASIIDRQPFPGPGLAVRIVGEVTAEKLDLLKKADYILQQEASRCPSFTGQAWQYFAVLTGIQSVGVREGKRTYGPALAIRAVSSEDGMTAEWILPPVELLQRFTCRVYQEIPEITRVLLDTTSKPPGTIEWE